MSEARPLWAQALATSAATTNPASATETPAAVTLERVVKRYDDVLALDGVDLAVAHGEFMAISGPSGCGKSTLLHLVAALDAPTSGTVSVNGQDLARIRNISDFRRQEVGLVFQLHNLLPQVSVLTNIEVVMYGTHRNTKARRARSLELVEEVDLVGREQRLPTQLSGGERQRVAIARALANYPRLLLADEPTGNLDAESVRRIMALFHQVNANGVTILLVTHDEGLAASADRVAAMEGGRIVSIAPRPGEPDGRHP